jgi:hypothetical protein
VYIDAEEVMHVGDTFDTIRHYYALPPGLHNTGECKRYGERYISNSDLKGIEYLRSSVSGLGGGFALRW